MDKCERFNFFSHLLGAVLALGGMAGLIVKGIEGAETRKLLSFITYGITLQILYLASTLYHGLDGRLKARFRTLEHQAIYLLIAGTYTPFALVALNGATGWWLFLTVWCLAVVGILFDAVPRPGKRILPVLLYLLMGWLALFTLEPLMAVLPTEAIHWLFAGGILYTAGVFFFSLNHWYRWAHGIWHLFVLAGSISHYFAVVLYV